MTPPEATVPPVEVLMVAVVVLGGAVARAAVALRGAWRRRQVRQVLEDWANENATRRW